MNKNKIKKIILTGGGTGGHLIPSFAIADKLKALDKNLKIKFIGSKWGIESKLYKDRKETYHLIDIKGFKRKISIFSIYENIVLFPIRFVKSILQVLIIFIQFKPDAIIGTGGYSSAVPLLVAKIKKVKIYIQEQNAIPGLVNKFFLKSANKVFFGFKNECNEKKYYHSGNPILNVVENSLDKSKKNIENNFTIFIIGGSQGSVPINDHFYKNYHHYVNENIKIIWQCGQSNFSKIKKNISNENIELLGFIQPKDMNLYYKKADLVICRSGALTLTELANYCVPSILIPLPNSANNHQFQNAKYFSDYNAAITINQKELKKGILEKTFLNILNEKKKLEKMKLGLQKISMKNSAEYISKEILDF
ncbi:MAG: undecaprenyldiphospho-muramoylpentapeptide beta-N-acetylglucosaminyltransferase [Candidatus Marinimicrobia bacterium]|nr:undecaprenyldiphospho-muramoylpentapeptide beta-N-acetylglucosaminyltransferase [Candidatus Neomarinimicrobiota bacterium]